jgi:hypothetical protein
MTNDQSGFMMNCKQILQRLLATSGPRTISAEVRDHLEGCERCRRWATRLQEIDAAIPLLPVPDFAAAKAALMQEFLAPPAALPEPVWAPRRLRVNWVRIVFVSAAAVVLVLAVSGVFNREKPRTTPAPQDALLARVLDRQLELSKASTVEKRVEALDHLAADLDGGALQLAYVADKADLEALANLYESVVAGSKGLVTRAEDVPLAGGKKMLEDIAKRLGKVNRDAEARLRDGVPPDAVAALRRIKDTARAAQTKLEKKINEEKVAQDVTPRSGDRKS